MPGTRRKAGKSINSAPLQATERRPGLPVGFQHSHTTVAPLECNDADTNVLAASSTPKRRRLNDKNNTNERQQLDLADRTKKPLVGDTLQS